MSRHYRRHAAQPSWADTPDEAAYVIEEQARAEEDWAEAKRDAENDPLFLALDKALAGRPR